MADAATPAPSAEALAAAEHLLKLRKAADSFQGFVALHRPTWKIPDFHAKLIDILDKFERGTLTHVDLGGLPEGCDPNVPPDRLVNNLVVNMPPRHAKAIDCDTPMLTPAGWQRAGDLQIGDKLISSCGRWTTITGVHPQGVKPAHRVTFSDGTSLIACGEHRWAARLRGKPTKGHPAPWRTKTTDELAPDLLEADGRKKWRIPTIEPHSNAPASLPIDPYLLGCWLGDGSSYYAAITTMDQEIVDAFAEYEPRPFSHQSGGRATTYGLRNGFRAKLCALDLLANKHIPAIYLTANREQRLALLQGIADTDGTANLASGQTSICLSNAALSEDVRTLIASLGGTCTVYSAIPKQGRRFYKKHFRLPVGQVPFRLPRKIANFTPHSVRNTPRRFFASIDPVEPREMVCFTVDAPDHLFAAGRDLILTHNTEYCTKLFPAYYLARKPDRFVMSTSYNAELGKEFGRNTRDIATDALTQKAFAEFRVRKDSQAADEWRTTQGGAYFGIGLGGTTSGRPASLLIIDDPLKSREDAESATMRNKVWSFYTSALAMRLQPEVDLTPHKQLVILTRWHPDDLAGRLMETDEWKKGDWGHISFPGIIEEPDAKDPTIVHERALWPERFPLAELHRRRRLNEREFAALYQQSPYILGGNLLRSDWWQYYKSDERPDSYPLLIIAADTAFKTSEQSDYSVFVILGMTTGGDIHVVDVQRKRLPFPELKQRAIQLNNRWRGKGLRGLYVEDKASGQSLIQELKRESGVSVIPYRVSRDKVARVNSVSPLIEGGRVFLPEEAPWLDDFLEEAIQFPASAHDDQVDALALGLDVLSRISLSPEAATYAGPAFTSIEQATADSLNNVARTAPSSLGKPLTSESGFHKRLPGSAAAPAQWSGWGE